MTNLEKALKRAKSIHLMIRLVEQIGLDESNQKILLELSTELIQLLEEQLKINQPN